MNGFRFYADLPNVPELSSRITVRQLRDLDKGGASCIALLIGEEHRCPDGSQEALVSVTLGTDQGVCLGSVSRDYLRKCRRVPESIARNLHPRLFARLDTAD